MRKLKIINKRKTKDGDILVRADSDSDWKKVTEKEGSIEYEIKATDKWLNFILNNLDGKPLYISASTKKERTFSIEVTEVNKDQFGISFPLDSLYTASAETDELKAGQGESVEVSDDPPA